MQTAVRVAALFSPKAALQLSLGIIYATPHEAVRGVLLALQRPGNLV